MKRAPRIFVPGLFALLALPQLTGCVDEETNPVTTTTETTTTTTTTEEPTTPETTPSRWAIAWARS